MLRCAKLAFTSPLLKRPLVNWASQSLVSALVATSPYHQRACFWFPKVAFVSVAQVDETPFSYFFHWFPKTSSKFVAQANFQTDSQPGPFNSQLGFNVTGA